MHLIVGIDGSEASDRALEHALEIATATDGRVTAVHAVDPQVYEQREGGGPITDRSDAEQRIVLETIEEAEARGEELLEVAVAAADPEMVDTELLYGDPVQAISEYVEGAADVDGIVVGHRRLAEEYERLLGSVAKGLVERAPAPVTVVR